MGKREITERKILESAIAVISEKGFNAAKTSEIASRADISEATLFKYYKTKKGLLDCIVLNSIDIFGKEIGYKPIKDILQNHKEDSFELVIDLIIDDRLQVIKKYHKLLKIIISEAQFHADVRDQIIKNIITPIVKDFNIFMAYQIEVGNVRDDLDINIVFRSFFSMIFVSMIQRVIMDQPMNIEIIKKEMKRLRLYLLMEL